MNEVCSLDKHQLVFNPVKQKCGKYETFLCHRVSELYIISAKNPPRSFKKYQVKLKFIMILFLIS